MATARAQHRFTVKEYGDGQPFIMLELLKGPELPVIGRGFLALDLNAGTTLDRAREIADALNQSVAATAYTL